MGLELFRSVTKDHVSLRLHCHVQGVHAVLLALLEPNCHWEDLYDEVYYGFAGSGHTMHVSGSH